MFFLESLMMMFFFVLFVNINIVQLGEKLNS
jgi:hypothetical protein